MKPYNPEIIELCLENKPITEISKRVGLSYKSTFFRIKELKKLDVLKINDENKIFLSKEYKRLIEEILGSFKERKKMFQKDFEGRKKEELLILKFLKLLKDNRFMNLDEFYNLINEKDVDSASDLFDYLRELGYIKERLEITKKGINYLKELSKNAVKKP